MERSTAELFSAMEVGGVSLLEKFETRSVEVTSIGEKEPDRTGSQRRGALMPSPGSNTSGKKARKKDQ